jgi:sortase A
MEVTADSPVRGGREQATRSHRRNTQILGWTLIWSGVLIFGYLGWQLVGTDLVNSRVQAAAEQTLGATLVEARDQPSQIQEIEDDAGGTVEFYPEPTPTNDTGFALIRIRSLGLEAVVFEGVAAETLNKGPGHMPGTALPGQPGNSVISGHRTTYGRPFYDLDLLSAGDRIEVETAVGVHVYEVRESFVVAPTDVWVTDDRPGGWLTLTTCHPRFSARERLIVTAEMVQGPNLEYVRLLGERFDEVS